MSGEVFETTMRDKEKLYLITAIAPRIQGLAEAGTGCLKIGGATASG